MAPPPRSNKTRAHQRPSIADRLDSVSQQMQRSTFPIVERDPSVLSKALFALTRENPDHDADECSNEDQKIDCRVHGCSSVVGEHGNDRANSGIIRPELNR